jgi:integrase
VIRKPRRANREGSVYFRKSDKKWVASVTLENGKRKVVYASTQQEAIKKRNALIMEQEQGKVITKPNQTVAQYLEYWLEIYSQSIRPRSYERYEQIMRLHIVPVLGKMRLDKLLPQHVQSLYAQKQEEGLSANTVLTIHNMLHRALKSAVRWGLVSQNMCESVELPLRIPYRMQPLTLEQTQSFLDAVRGHPNEALFVLAVTTGMRRGELAGLKWQDVDLEKGELHVRRSLVRIPTKMGGGYIEAEPKTEKSRRSILFPNFALEVLKVQQKRQQEIKWQADNLWQEHDYVFCTHLGEHINPGHDILEEFKKILKRADLPNVRFHDLRHGTATLL